MCLDEGATTRFDEFLKGNFFEIFCNNFVKRVAWPMHCYMSLLYCFTSFIYLVVGAQDTFSTFYTAQNSFNNQHFRNGKTLFFFVYFHEKVTHPQYPIPQVCHIKLDSLVLLVSNLRSPIHVLRNTISESTIICHIQIKVIRILHCSLLLFAAGFGAASVAAFVLAFRVILCPRFLFGAAFGFGFGSFA